MDYIFKENIPYKKTGNLILYLDIISAKPFPQNAPCAVFFHGGGWKEGSKKDVWGFPILLEKLLESGIIVASIQYRLVNNNGGGFPTSVEDVLDALKFLDTLPINKNRKCVMGISSGAYLALQVALCQNSTNVTAVLSMSGITYLKGCDKDFSNLFVPDMTQICINDFIGSYNKNQSFNPADLLSLRRSNPKILLVHCDKDECVNIESARAFYKRAKENNFDIKYIEVKNSNHTFSRINGTQMKPTYKDLMENMAIFIVNSI